MIRLAQLQDEFQAYLLDRPSTVETHVDDTAKAAAGTLLGVYRHAYGARLAEALGEDYEVVRQIVGDAAFAKFAAAYIAAHPSRHFSLGPFGRHLPHFLGTTQPWSAKPYLAELARFEWSLRRAFDAADAEPMGIDALVAVPVDAWSDLTFRLLPSFTRLDLAWTVPQAWQAVKAGAEAVPPPERRDPPVAWAVWRPELVSEFRSLEPDEAWALDAIVAGANFAAMCEGMSHWHDANAAPARAAGLLRVWIEQGMLAGIAPTARVDA
ncbi:MAG: DUF2063 domain-containing protein [Alphaproteobacteria bacterium]|nr:DUF2063 domain-containing protein [Alphaproteobacteria bacterium]